MSLKLDLTRAWGFDRLEGSLSVQLGSG